MGNSLINKNKIGYSQGGIDSALSILRGTLNRLSAPTLSNQLAVLIRETIVVPKIFREDKPVGDRANRLLPDMQFSATIQGAIHKFEVAGIIQI